MLGEILEKTRKQNPLVHCMVNLVTANDCANLALACGASPIMAEDLEEVEQVVSACDGLVLNLGTPSPRKVQALLLAGKTAKNKGKPVIFDPVGAGCSDFRKNAALEILTQADIIRGNASEIRTLLRGTMAHRGVDAEKVAEEPLELAKLLAQRTGAVVVVSGDVDIVTDGAVSNRGGCHLNGGYLVIMEGLGLHMDSQTPKAKADLTMTFQDLMETISASGQCLFTSYAFFPGFLLTKPNGILTKTVNAAAPHIGWAVRLINKCPRIAAIHLPIFQHTKMIELAVGMKMNFGRYLEIGERGYTMERYINTKFGISAANDKLPKRLTDVPQDPNDPKTKIPLETMKKTYYQARGWDHNGIPTEKLLRRLKIK